MAKKLVVKPSYEGKAIKVNGKTVRLIASNISPEYAQELSNKGFAKCFHLVDEPTVAAPIAPKAKEVQPEKEKPTKKEAGFEKLSHTNDSALNDTAEK